MKKSHLVGPMFVVAPVVLFLCLGVLWPAAGLQDATPGEELNAIMGSQNLSWMLAILGTFAQFVIWVGYGRLAQFLAESGKPASGAAMRASVGFLAVAAVSIVGSGLQLGSIQVASEGLMRHAEMVYLVGNNVGNAVGIIAGIATIFLGIAMVRQYGDDSLGRIIGILLLIFGSIFFVVTVIPSLGDTILLWIAWIGWTISTILVGVWITINSAKEVG